MIYMHKERNTDYEKHFNRHEKVRVNKLFLKHSLSIYSAFEVQLHIQYLAIWSGKIITNWIMSNNLHYVKIGLSRFGALKLWQSDQNLSRLPTCNPYPLFPQSINKVEPMKFWEQRSWMNLICSTRRSAFSMLDESSGDSGEGVSEFRSRRKSLIACGD